MILQRTKRMFSAYHAKYSPFTTEIAKLYCVTVDDLFKEHSVAYANYAQRLASVYEDSRKLEDFVRADLEFQKLKIVVRLAQMI